MSPAYGDRTGRVRGQQTPIQPTQFVCEYCRTPFQRREHLNRHLRCHLQMKPFSCRDCGKSFSRKDTLKRHTVVHGHPLEGPCNRAPQACRHCIQSKQRCSGQGPCDRCSRRGLQCHFAKSVAQSAECHVGSPQQEDPELQSSRTQCDAVTNGELARPLPKPPKDQDTGEVLTTELDTPIHFDFSWNLPTLPFSFPFEIGGLDTSEVIFDFDDFPLAFDNTTAHHTPDDQLMSRPGQMEDTESLYVIPSSADGPDMQKVSSLQTQGRNNQKASTFPHFPTFSPEDVDIIISEDPCHVAEVSAVAYEALLSMYRDVVPDATNHPFPPFPNREVINAFAQLYFEFFHPPFPVLHQASFQHLQDSTYLLLAVVAIGCQYSRIKTRGKCSQALLEILRLALSAKIKFEFPLQHDLHLVQATLLCTFCLTFCGKYKTLTQAQYFRNILVTMCRPFLARSILFRGFSAPETKKEHQSWSGWVAAESWIRVVYFTWYTEYLHWTLFDLPPLISISELRACLPSAEKMWQISDPIELSRWIQSEKGASPPSVLDLLHGERSSKHSGASSLKSLGNSALLFTVVSACAEERGIFQTLNPTFSEPSSGSAFGVHARHSSYLARATTLANDAMEGITEQLNASRLNCNSSPVIVGTFSASRKVHAISMIIRHVPYTLMYVSSGWMASKTDTERSLQLLTKRLHFDPRLSRTALIHAAQVFRRIRNQRWLDAYDPLFLLLATLYIWYYDKILGRQEVPETSMWPPVKIDQDDIDKRIWKQWAEDGSHSRPHIAGIGILDGRQSVPRILKEAIRILNNGQGWQHFAHVISRSLHRLLSGFAPSVEDGQ